MSKLYAENEVKGMYQFKSPHEFINSDVVITEEIGLGNPFIKGCVHSGKTEKILKPLFDVWNGGKLYVDVKGTFDDKIISNEDIYREFGYNLEYEIVEKLIDGRSVLVDVSEKVRSGEIKSISDFINVILGELNYKNPKEKILICLDELSYLGYLDYLIQSYKHDNICIAATLQYSRQLKRYYSEKDISLIKEYVTMYDTEKQLR